MGRHHQIWRGCALLLGYRPAQACDAARCLRSAWSLGRTWYRSFCHDSGGCKWSWWASAWQSGAALDSGGGDRRQCIGDLGILSLMDATVGVRLHEEDEVLGLDTTLHGELAYRLFAGQQEGALEAVPEPLQRAYLVIVLISPAAEMVTTVSAMSMNNPCSTTPVSAFRSRARDAASRPDSGQSQSRM